MNNTQERCCDAKITFDDLIENESIVLFASTLTTAIQKYQEFLNKKKIYKNATLLTTFPIKTKNIKDQNFLPSLSASNLRIYFVKDIFNFSEKINNLKESDNIFCSFTSPNHHTCLYFDLDYNLSITQQNILFNYIYRSQNTTNQILNNIGKNICNMLYKIIQSKLHSIHIDNDLFYVATSSHRFKNDFVTKLSFHLHFSVLFKDIANMKAFIVNLNFPQILPLIFSPENKLIISWFKFIDMNVYRNGPGIFKCAGSYKPGDPKSKSIFHKTNINNFNIKFLFPLTCMHNFELWQNKLIDLSKHNFNQNTIKTHLLAQAKFTFQSNSAQTKIFLNEIKFNEKQTMFLHNCLNEIFSIYYPNILQNICLIKHIFIDKKKNYISFDIGSNNYNCSTCDNDTNVWFVYSKQNYIKFICQNNKCRILITKKYDRQHEIHFLNTNQNQNLVDFVNFWKRHF
jgi:hypothetical protein